MTTPKPAEPAPLRYAHEAAPYPTSAEQATPAAMRAYHSTRAHALSLSFDKIGEYRRDYDSPKGRRLLTEELHNLLFAAIYNYLDRGQSPPASIATEVWADAEDGGVLHELCGDWMAVAGIDPAGIKPYPAPEDAATAGSAR